MDHYLVNLGATDDREFLRVFCDLALSSFMYDVLVTATANSLRDAR